MEISVRHLWKAVIGAFVLAWIGGCTAALVNLGNEKPHRIVYCGGHVKKFDRPGVLTDGIVYCGDGTFERYRGDVEYR